MAGLCGLALVSCLILLTARTKAAGVGSVPLAECCPGHGGMPPHPRMVLLGETGVGKSTLGNRLFDKKPGMCASSDSLLNQTHPQLGVGHGSDSHTNETAWIAGKWLGDRNSPCFTVIDTPGIGDVAGRDCEHGVIISEAVKNLSQIDAFVLMFKGTQSRFTKPLQDQLSVYQEMFGVNFWKRIIIEISYWRSSNYAKEERMEDRSIDEWMFSDDLNRQLKKKFKLTRTIPVIFIDPMYTQNRGRRNPEEKVTFKKETEKLWNFMQSGDPYTCEKLCKSPGFLEAKPVLKSEPNVNATLGAKVIVDFSIWFAGCDGVGDRNYDIYKDGVHIWTVIDEGEKGEKRKPQLMIDTENAPPHMKVFDACSKSTGKRRDCNIELSKYKNVRVMFEEITQDCFGTYYVNNTNGKSEEVHIHKKADGFYSEWTEWSVWKKEFGGKKRTRVCTEPERGGLPCSVQGPPAELCNSDKCAGRSVHGFYSEWTEWSVWKKELGAKTRTRVCTEHVNGGIPCSALGLPKEQCNTDICAGKTIDGFYTGWAEWSVWKKELQAKKRTRVCIEPVNGGLPCSGQQQELCNNHICAEPSSKSQWSDWKCQEACSIPHDRGFETPSEPEKRTTEIRTRTCTDSTPVHATDNCATAATTQTSTHQCGGRSEVPHCPAMMDMKTKVCNWGYAGTNDNVFIEFKNNLGETCATKWLDQAGNDFKDGAIDGWEKYLGSCDDDSFRPIGGLRVRFVTNTEGSNLHHDRLDLCTIAAQFGLPGVAGYSIWQWNSGDHNKDNWDKMKNTHWIGSYDSKSQWVTMTKIAG